MSKYQELTKELVGKKIFVTGATGFIGYRLTELLVKDYKAEVSVLIRDYGRAYRLGRLPVKIFKGDITNKKDIEAAMGEAEYVFHCAYGNKGTFSSRESVNIQGTEYLLELASLRKVKAFVFVSTVSVYGGQTIARLEETTPKIIPRHSYGKSKLLAEEKVLAYYKNQALNTVVIQPTAVYGPYAPSYAMRIFEQAKTHQFPLIDGGKGICNAVYVDDLVQALLLASISPKAYGQSYLINGSDYCSWKDFYTFFENILKEKITTNISREEAIAYGKKMSRKKGFFSILIGAFRVNREAIKELLRFKLFYYLFVMTKKLLPASIYLRLKKDPGSQSSASLIPNSKHLIALSEEDVSFYLAQTRVSIEKATRELHYSPVFKLEQGFKEVAAWYNWFYNK
jgi:nucleoside-diphosphate-sugar epimerase